jgi:hypothetical protein
MVKHEAVVVVSEFRKKRRRMEIYAVTEREGNLPLIKESTRLLSPQKGRRSYSEHLLHQQAIGSNLK